MKKIAVLAVVLAAVMTPAISGATGLTMFSGKTLELGNAINVSVGVPDVSVLYLHALTPVSDIGGYFRMGYLTPVGLHGGSFWLTPGFTGKYMFINNKTYNMSFKANVGPVFNLVGGPLDAFMGGFSMEPYVSFGIPFKDVVTINLGVGLPVNLLFNGDATLALIPIAFTFGTEVFINPELSVVFNGELGPGIWACRINGATQSDVDLYGLFKVGVNFGL